MTTKTKFELAKFAMQEIKRLSNGEELSAEDKTYVEGKIDGLHAELTELEIVYWDEDEIPDAMVPSYTRVVAADIAGRYTSLQEAAYFLNMRQPAILNMQRLTTRQDPPVDAEEKFF